LKPNRFLDPTSLVYLEGQYHLNIAQEKAKERQSKMNIDVDFNMGLGDGPSSPFKSNDSPDRVHQNRQSIDQINSFVKG